MYNDRITQMTGLKQIVKFPTRGKNTLDQIFTNISVINPPRCFSPIGKSDHSCVLWSHEIRPASRVKIKRSVRVMSQSNVAHFSSMLSDIDWLKYVSSFNCIDDAFFNFQTALTSVFDLSFPKRMVRFRSTDQPWVKPSLKLLIDDRDRAFSLGHYCKYQRLRKAVIKHIQVLKSKYLSSFLSKDARLSWKAIHVTARSKVSQTSIPDSITAEDFNDFFQSNFQNSQPPTVPSHSGLSVVSPTLSVFEVHYQLSKLQRKACAPDDVPFWVYRNFPSLKLQLKRQVMAGDRTKEKLA
ncbi:MAG: hypothetical protein AAGK05_17620 [Pseudomonadota bacterium]